MSVLSKRGNAFKQSGFVGFMIGLMLVVLLAFLARWLKLQSMG